MKIGLLIHLLTFGCHNAQETAWYTPNACHERSYALEPSCPLASICFPEFPCPSVFAGKFNHKTKVIPSCIYRDPANPPVKKLALWPRAVKWCNDTKTRRGVKGHFLEGRWHDYPFNKTDIDPNYCEYHWYCPDEVFPVINDYVLVFIGDSLIRQLFNRLIWHYRGLQEIIEHYYHQDAHYCASLTNDMFSIRKITSMSDIVDLGSSSIDLLFFWSTAGLMDKIQSVHSILQSGRFKGMIFTHR